MARFAVGQAIRSVEPTIVVDAGLPAGAHRFQLEVIDSTGQRSAPAVAVVTIQRLTIPVPPVVAGRIKVPKHFDLRSAASRRNLGIQLARGVWL